MGEKKEYIERGALIEFVKEHTPNINGDTTMRCVERALKNAPVAADVVQVVRCEKCKYARMIVDIIGNPQLFCGVHNQFPSVNFDDFCSLGERKEQT